MVAGQLAVALAHVAANDHRLNVGGTRSEDHDGDRVAEPVEVRGSHADDRDISLFAWRQRADLVLKVTSTSASCAISSPSRSSCTSAGPPRARHIAQPVL